MQVSPSKRALKISPSPIRKLLPFELEAKSKGIHIYKLNIGQPDIPTPHNFFESMAGEMPETLAYGPSQGIPQFRQAVSAYYQDYNIPFNENDIMATTGGSEALFFSFLAIADPGDEIIVFEPFYTNYNGFAIYADVKLVPYSLRAENGFHLPEAKDIEQLITPRTKAILMCSPNNPTGTVLRQDELEILAELALKHNLFLISDEVYREFAYDGVKPASIMSIPEVHNHSIVIDSISKRFSACGARIGNLATKNSDIFNAVLKFGQARLCPATAEQIGAAALYSLRDDYFNQIREEYRKRRNTIYEELMEIPQVVCQKPKGAFYIMVKLPIDDGNKFAKWLLTDFEKNKETVMVAPGEGFYATAGLGKDEIRLAYILNSAHCKKAAKLLKEAVIEYNN
ncbi:MAG: pyridoxal phosphate-dependent aminotransferase [Myxococcota bacterium]